LARSGDETHFERDIAEMALAHNVGDEVEQAYRRGTALKKETATDGGVGSLYVEGPFNVVTITRST
jgi:hypothetical protein